MITEQERRRVEWASHAPGLNQLIKEWAQWAALDNLTHERQYAQLYYAWFANELVFIGRFDYGY